MENILLDSTILIEILRGKMLVDQSKNNFINPIIYAEVLYGLLYIGKDASKFNDFLIENNIEILDITRDTSEIYAKMKLHQNKLGKSLADNDLLIAASAFEYDYLIATKNIKHFSRIPNLRITEKY